MKSLVFVLVLQAALARATPRSLPTITVLVEPIEGLGLFRDENQAAMEVVSAWAQRQGLKVVPVQKAEQVLQRARAGQRIDTGEQCGRPLPRWSAVERYQRALGVEGRLGTNVICDGRPRRCELHLSVVGLGGRLDGETLLDQQARFDWNQPLSTALPRALATLKPVPPGEGGLGLLGGLGSGKVQARSEVLELGTRPALASDASSVAGPLTLTTDLLKACLNPAGGNLDLLAAVDARGHVTRCEPRGGDEPGSLCACEVALKSARATARETRAYLNIRWAPADLVTPWNAVVSASTRTYLDEYRTGKGESRWRPSVSDPSISDWEPPPDAALARCFVDVATRQTTGAAVTVHFDGRGVATSVDVLPSKKRPISETQVACVQQAYLASRAPCPDLPSSRARAHLEVVVRPIGEPMSTPFD